MSIKKLILFLVPIALIVAVCLSTDFNFIARTYTGFLMDTKNKKILRTYPIKISGTYKKGEENKFNGYLFLDGERYYLTGSNLSSDNKNVLIFNTHNKIGASYSFSYYDNFNKNSDFEIHSDDLNSSTLIIASNNNTEDSILNNVK